MTNFLAVQTHAQARALATDLGWRKGPRHDTYLDHDGDIVHVCLSDCSYRGHHIDKLYVGPYPFTGWEKMTQRFPPPTVVHTYQLPPVVKRRVWYIDDDLAIHPAVILDPAFVPGTPDAPLDTATRVKIRFDNSTKTDMIPPYRLIDRLPGDTKKRIQKIMDAANAISDFFASLPK